ncbi:MAG: hypothetical protein J7515_11745 [Caulobacter sp.]|nr:hypothetical protein [Caulobacter sp.]
MGLLKDMWRVGLVRAPIADLLAPGALARHEVTWIPDPGQLRFLADPMGVWRGDRLYVFAEIYDYRDRVGAIEVLTFDQDLNLLSREPALSEPWHLSYPFIIEADGETYMLPEAHKSGRLTLYRAEEFPTKWAPVTTIELDQVAIDATPVFHDGRWWLFYTPATTKAEKVSALHVAWADRLTGPWTPHPANPVRFDRSSSRPGGTPIIVDGAIVLPMQDCRRTYGGAIRMLRVTTLTPDRFEAEADEPITALSSFRPLTAGLHTLSAAGPVTLIDAKRFEISPLSLALDVRREWTKRVRGQTA